MTPDVCRNVKCMRHSCPNEAKHKVAEENPWIDQQSVEYKKFNAKHVLTTYLCDKHFYELMDREEYYGDVKKYRHPNASLDGCPFVYCDSDPKCEDKCRYAP